jgi:NAD(P)-dependent dehydrogenase (short-subunit alcohol dehydrogenase family)
VNVTRNLSRAQGSKGIGANCVLPGLTDTEEAASVFEDAMAATGRSEEAPVESILRKAPIDVGRMGTVAEVAAAVIFLCSERASWITGIALPNDGGTIRSAP